jgi:hypothetical protein
MKRASCGLGGCCFLAFGSLAIGVTLLSGVARGATPCRDDIDKFCADVPIGGGRIQECLKNHEKDLSPECAGRHENLEKEMGRLVAICRYDISFLCSDVSPGRGRVARCLERHRSELSPVCKDQLEKARDAGGK